MQVNIHLGMSILFYVLISIEADMNNTQQSWVPEESLDVNEREMVGHQVQLGTKRGQVTAATVAHLQGRTS